MKKIEKYDLGFTKIHFYNIFLTISFKTTFLVDFDVI